MEHLQREGPVFDQPLTLLRRLQAQLAGLGLQSRHLLLNETAHTESLMQPATAVHKYTVNTKFLHKNANVQLEKVTFYDSKVLHFIFFCSMNLTS